MGFLNNKTLFLYRNRFSVADLYSVITHSILFTFPLCMNGGNDLDARHLFQNVNVIMSQHQF